MKVSLMIWFILLQTTFHSFHLSVCEIKYISAEESLQISLRIFLDDLEEVITKESPGNEIDILSPSDKSKLDELIRNYVLSHFLIRINNRAVPLDYIGNRIKDDVMVCYIEVTKAKNIRNIEIENTILFELYNDQTNLIHITKNSQVKSLKLNSRTPSSRIQY